MTYPAQPNYDISQSLHSAAKIRKNNRTAKEKKQIIKYYCKNNG
jgi:hypothetical protein